MESWLAHREVNILFAQYPQKLSKLAHCVNCLKHKSIFGQELQYSLFAYKKYYFLAFFNILGFANVFSYLHVCDSGKVICLACKQIQLATVNSRIVAVMQQVLGFKRNMGLLVSIRCIFCTSGTQDLNFQRALVSSAYCCLVRKKHLALLYSTEYQVFIFFRNISLTDGKKQVIPNISHCFSSVLVALSF